LEELKARVAQPKCLTEDRKRQATRSWRKGEPYLVPCWQGSGPRLGSGAGEGYHAIPRGAGRRCSRCLGGEDQPEPGEPVVVPRQAAAP
jgi:hypothetical protein